jgi:hypothetical protein
MPGRLALPLACHRARRHSGHPGWARRVALLKVLSCRATTRASTHSAQHRERYQQALALLVLPQRPPLQVRRAPPSKGTSSSRGQGARRGPSPALQAHANCSGKTPLPGITQREGHDMGCATEQRRGQGQSRCRRRLELHLASAAQGRWVAAPGALSAPGAKGPRFLARCVALQKARRRPPVRSRRLPRRAAPRGNLITAIVQTVGRRCSDLRVIPTTSARQQRGDCGSAILHTSGDHRQ